MEFGEGLGEVVGGDGLGARVGAEGWGDEEAGDVFGLEGAGPADDVGAETVGGEGVPDGRLAAGVQGAGARRPWRSGWTPVAMEVQTGRGRDGWGVTGRPRAP